MVRSDFGMIKIFYLPVSRWKEYKEIRLYALKSEKFAFSKSYSEEKNNLPSFWKGRLESKSVIVAEEKEKIIGIAAFVFSSKKVTKHVAEIFSVYVLPEQRGKGVSKKLFKFILKEAKKKKIKKIELGVFADNLFAKKFYLKQGFKVIGKHEKEFFINGKYCDEIIMEKFL